MAKNKKAGRAGKKQKAKQASRPRDFDYDDDFGGHDVPAVAFVAC
jgi:hypothetical protein